MVSHATAARAWGMWLPQALEDTVHVTRGAGGAWPRIAGVTGHSTQVPPEHVRTVTDATGTWRLTSPAWTWTDLAAVGMTVEELVIAGDALLQRPVRPRPGDLARHPLSHMDELAELVAARGSIRGVRALRQALPQLRGGVDSPQESRLRLGLVASGWPEPEVNPEVPVLTTPDGRVLRHRKPDLAYRRVRLGLEPLDAPWLEEG